MTNIDLHLLMTHGFGKPRQSLGDEQTAQIEGLHMSFRGRSKLPIDFTYEVCRGLDFDSTQRVLENLLRLSPQTAAVISALYVRN